MPIRMWALMGTAGILWRRAIESPAACKGARASVAPVSMRQQLSIELLAADDGASANPRTGAALTYGLDIVNSTRYLLLGIDDFTKRPFVGLHCLLTASMAFQL